jgi:hypothetical protein
MADDDALHAWLAREGAHNDFVAWARPFGADIGALWQACPRGDWLLALATRLRAPTRALVVAACGCAEAALDHVPPEHAEVGVRLAELRTWAESTLPALTVERIESMRGQLESARDAATDAAHAEAVLATLAALETVGDPAFAASAAAFAAQATMVSAADCAMMEALRFAQHQGAETVRAALPEATMVALWSQRERRA